MAFGGAGPLHAARLARELDIARVLVPRNPGILCAMGLLLTDLRADFAITRLRTLAPAVVTDMREAFQVLNERAIAWFDQEGIGAENRRVARTVDMRYAGQNYELSVPLPDGEINEATLAALGDRVRRRASTDLRLRRRGRTGATGHLPGRSHGACAESVIFAPRR